MYLGLAGITYALLHVAMWVVLLAVIIPFALFIWFVIDDLFLEDKSRIKAKFGLDEQVKKEKATSTVREENESKLPVRKVSPTKESQIVYLDKEFTYYEHEDNLKAKEQGKGDKTPQSDELGQNEQI